MGRGLWWRAEEGGGSRWDSGREIEDGEGAAVGEERRWVRWREDTIEMGEGRGGGERRRVGEEWGIRKDEKGATVEGRGGKWDGDGEMKEDGKGRRECFQVTIK